MTEHVVTVKKVLAMPTRRDRGELAKKQLARVRRHHKKWEQPSDAALILNFHFSVKTFGRGSYHADATLEIPVPEGFQYFSVAKGCKTAESALLSVIKEIENSHWFHYMKSQRVYFRITGTIMEELYRGYL